MTCQHMAQKITGRDQIALLWAAPLIVVMTCYIETALFIKHVFSKREKPKAPPHILQAAKKLYEAGSHSVRWEDAGSIQDRYIKQAKEGK